MPLRFGIRILNFSVYLSLTQSNLLSKIIPLGFQTQDNNEILAYWLSNASTLLLLLQRTLKASGAAGMAPQRRRSSSATLFGRMTQVIPSPSSTFNTSIHKFSFPQLFHPLYFCFPLEFPWNPTRCQSFLNQWRSEWWSGHFTAS